ncbi:MAG TPA: TIR domain-containing protein [Chthoniobacterales bacterium]|nr:TIR domain-containing protein [Chthoniobacterales bacterium]
MKYWAFISYSHLDKVWGDWLHKALETYRVPRRLVGGPSRDGEVPARLFPIFRDREELPVSADLSTNINQALQESRYLIVICSPHSARSRWVGEEITTFKALGREDRILALIVDGEPNAEGKPGFAAADECFHPNLRYRWAEGVGISDTPSEPIAADAREGKDGKHNAKLKLLAGLLGVNYDDLRQREHERRLRRARRIGMAALALVAVFAGLAIWAVLAAREASRQKRQTQRLLVATDSARSQEFFDRGDAATAVAFLARAAEQDPDERSVAAERLWFALTQRSWPILVAPSMRHAGAIASVRFSPDGARVLTASRDGTVRLWETSSGNPTGPVWAHPKPLRRALFTPDGDRVISVCLDGSARILDPKKDFSAALTLNNPDSINAVAVSAKSACVATGSTDGTVRLWSTETGRLLGEIKRPENVHTLLFHPTDETLLLGVSGTTASLWKVPEGTAVFEFQHDGDINSAEFDGDGGRILTASKDRTARIWDTRSGRVVGMELLHEDEVVDAKFSPDSQVIATSGGLKVSIWSGGARRNELVHEAAITTMKFSRDSRALFTASADGKVRQWNLASGEMIGEPITEASAVVALELDPSGRKLLLGMGNGTVRLWRPAPRYPISDRLVHAATIEKLVPSPNGALLAAACTDGSALLWDLAHSEKPRSTLAHKSAVLALAFNPDGSTMLTGGADATARLWETQSGASLCAPLAHPGTVSLVTFRPDGKMFATATENGVAQLWDATTKKRVGEPMKHPAQISALECTRDNRLLMTASWDGKIRFWDATTAQPAGAPFGTASEITAARIAPGNATIATGHRDGAVNVWSFSGNLLRAMSHKKSVNSLEFNSAGDYLVTGSDDGTASVWEVASGKPSGEAMQLDAAATAVAFDPGGNRVATGADNGRVRIWDARTGQPISEILRHEKAVTSLAFSADGTRLFSGSRDHTVRIWAGPGTINASDRQALVKLARSITPVALQASGRPALRAEEELKALSAEPESSAPGAIVRKWFLTDVMVRPLTPSASIDLRTFIRNRRSDNSPAAADEARFWEDGQATR